MLCFVNYGFLLLVFLIINYLCCCICWFWFMLICVGNFVWFWLMLYCGLFGV